MLFCSLGTNNCGNSYPRHIVQSQASFLEAASVAFDSLRSSKLRSFLTLLGIILSTATLIAVMSVIHGMDVYIANSASSMGTDGFRAVRMAFVGPRNPKAFLKAMQHNPQLSTEEYEFVKSRVTLSRDVGIAVNRAVRVAHGTDMIDAVQLTGVTANSAVMTNTQIDGGRFLSEIEGRRHMNVIFLGSDLKDRFFPSTDPIGKSVAIDGVPFEVIGFAKTKGSNAFGQSQDNFASIPAETYFKIYGSHVGISYIFLAQDRSQLEQAQDEVRMLMRSYRHLRPQEEDTFGLVSADTLVGLWDQLTGTLAAAAIGIVSVFMVVGGVVIMNIMLAVVSERTREIGVRKSVGARRKDILNQFLVESSMLSAMGGLIGVTIAWTIAVIVRNFTPVPMEVPLNAVVIGVSLSTAVGLFFGIYPARRASRLDPIVALRAES
jgi:putative ABC transport system permease protein